MDNRWKDIAFDTLLMSLVAMVVVGCLCGIVLAIRGTYYCVMLGLCA